MVEPREQLGLALDPAALARGSDQHACAGGQIGRLKTTGRSTLRGIEAVALGQHAAERRHRARSGRAIESWSGGRHGRRYSSVLVGRV